MYGRFMLNIFHSNQFFPVKQHTLSCFISNLFSMKYAYSTILTYVSSISYFCKLWSFPDPANSFLTRKLLTGVKRSANQIDSRLPITPTILEQIVTTLPVCFEDKYICILVKSMYLLAFHAFLRIGEISPASNAFITKVIQFRDVKIIHTPNSETSMEVLLRHCKGNLSKEPFLISIQASKSSNLCCVCALREFLKIRGFQSGPLFILKNGSPVFRQKFASLLKINLARNGFNVQLYKGHSFRIGAATSAAAAGVSEQEIMKLGRWKSLAYKRYIRIPNHIIKSKIL